MRSFDPLNQGEKGIILNAPFYLILFLSLLILHIYHIVLIPFGEAKTKLFFTVYATGEVSIEVLLLLTLSILIKKNLPRRALSFAIGLIAALFFVRILDFPLTRLMDMSFWYALGAFFHEKPSNIWEIALTSAIPLWVYFVVFSLCLAILWGFVKIYYYLDQRSQKYPLYLRLKNVYAALFLVFVFLCIWDYKLSGFAQGSDYQVFTRALPWKSTIFQEKTPSIYFPFTLRSGPKPLAIQNFLEEKSQALVKPNIVLCIAESIRQDFITKNIAPNLDRLSSESIPYKRAFSGGNATQLSWHSIFSGLTPLHFEKIGFERGKRGSPLIQKLKNQGYKVHVFTSSRLGYYEMDQRIFGEKKELTDTFFAAYENPMAHLNDGHLLEKASQMFPDAKKGGNLFIFFFESTHFPYSVASEIPPFTPYAHKINVAKEACLYPCPELICNRYKNALHGLDQKIALLRRDLEKNNLWDDALFIFTGDHGEEFYEKGNLFHASALSKQQTEVPLLIKPPRNFSFSRCDLLSHVDIAHAIFHLVFGFDGYTVGEGISPFGEKKRNFAVVGRYNASRSSEDIMIHNGENFLIVNVKNPSTLKILQAETPLDHSLFELFSPAFNFLFDPM